MFYDQFKALCDQKGVRPYTLVRALGAKSGHVVEQWKKGSTPRQPMLGQIAEYFGVSIDYLLTGEDSPTAQAAGLSDGDRELITLYQQLSPQQQDFLLTQLRALVPPPAAPDTSESDQ